MPACLSKSISVASIATAAIYFEFLGGAVFADDDSRNFCATCSQDHRTLIVPFVAPIVALILAGIVRYALRRYHLVRNLYVDVDYRLRFEILSAYSLSDQLGSLKGWANAPLLKPPPFLRIVQEQHFLLPTMQDDLGSCLWGNEVDAVRNFYRDFQLIECRAAKIEGLYLELVRKVAEDAEGSKIRLDIYIDQIECQLELIKTIVRFWVRILCKSTFEFDSEPEREFKVKLAFPGVARKLVFRRLVWYSTFVFVPIIALSSAFAGVFFGVFHPKYVYSLISTDLCPYLAGATIALFVFFVLPFWLKAHGDRKIEADILYPFASRLSGRLSQLPTNPHANG